MNASEMNLRLWQVAGHKIKIEFRESVLEALRITALKQLAVGATSVTGTRGELFGTRLGDAIRPNCAALLTTKPFANDGNSVLGWYSIRTAKDICMTREDLEYCQRAASNPQEIVLIIRPGGDESIRIGVFFREANGEIRSASSYSEVLVKAPASLMTEALPTTSQDRRKALPAVKSVSPTRVSEPISIAAIPSASSLPMARSTRGVPLAVGSLVAAIFVMITFLEIRALKHPKPQLPVRSRPASQTQQPNDHAVRLSSAKLDAQGDR